MPNSFKSNHFYFFHGVSQLQVLSKYQHTDATVLAREIGTLSDKNFKGILVCL